MNELTRQIYYAVQFERPDGRAALAVGKHAPVALFYQRKEAREFRDELTPHLKKKGKIVMVRQTLEVIPKP